MAHPSLLLIEHSITSFARSRSARHAAISDSVAFKPGPTPRSFVDGVVVVAVAAEDEDDEDDNGEDFVSGADVVPSKDDVVRSCGGGGDTCTVFSKNEGDLASAGISDLWRPASSAENTASVDPETGEGVYIAELFEEVRRIKTSSLKSRSPGFLNSRSSGLIVSPLDTDVVGVDFPIDEEKEEKDEEEKEEEEEEAEGGDEDDNGDPDDNDDVDNEGASLLLLLPNTVEIMFVAATDVVADMRLVSISFGVDINTDEDEDEDDDDDEEEEVEDNSGAEKGLVGCGIRAPKGLVDDTGGVTTTTAVLLSLPDFFSSPPRNMA